MTHITLTNTNSNSKYRKANINIGNGTCILDAVKKINLRQLIAEKNFQHQLLTTATIKPTQHTFVYKYSNTNELLNSAIYVYSILLKVDNPKDCTFKITPSANYKNVELHGKINFSINHAKTSQTNITLKQLNAIMTDIRGYKFEYREGVEIDEEFTLSDLPAFVDGDALFVHDNTIAALISTPTKLHRYEIRYIDPRIGCGLFAREAIKKDEDLFIYGGIKKIKIKHTDYCFRCNKDALHLSIDAINYGNLSRFVNHAFDDTSAHGYCLRPNVQATTCYLNGMLFVIYRALRDITSNEQLLIDYGEAYFVKRNELQFKINGRIIDKTKFLPRNNTVIRVEHLQILANHGVKDAQKYMLLRITTFAFAFILMLIMTNYCLYEFRTFIQ